MGVLRRAAAVLTVPAGALLPLALACGPASSTRPGPAPGEPCTGCNVVLISLDTLRADHLGAYGYERATSPNIDALAAEGVVFENAIAQSPWTLPSHMSILTSLYPYEHGVSGSHDLPDETLTLADVLHAEGYRTVAFTDGGWVSAERNYHTFDLFDDGRERGEPYRPARRWLAEVDDSEAPFFLFFHTYEPHCPYDPDPPFDRFSDPDYAGPVQVLDKCRRYFEQKVSEMDASDVEHVKAKYDGSILSTDTKLGGLFEVMEERGLDRNTIVVLTSDHGESFADREDPKRIGHGQLYEEILRVPLILRIPGSERRGRMSHLVESVDIMPTVIEALGLPVPEGLSGRSLFSAAEDRLAWSERTRLLPRGDDPEERARGSEYSIRDGRHRLLYYESEDRWELYDLAADPRQRESLHGRGLPEETRLRRALRGHVERARTLAPSRSARPTTLDGEDEKRLRALGYLD